MNEEPEEKSPDPVESLATYTETEHEENEVEEPIVWLYLDTKQFTSKPTGDDLGAVTNRIKRAKSKMQGVTASELCEAIKRGRTFVGGIYRDSEFREFRGMEVFAIDIDNGTHDAPLHEGDPGYLDPNGALDRCAAAGIWPLCLYFTFSADREKGITRFRLVFRTEPITDEGKAQRFALALLKLFPEADQQCSNLNRLYAGTRGELWETWRDEPCQQ